MPSPTPDTAQSDNSFQPVKVREKVIQLAAISLGRNPHTLDINESLYGTQSGFDSIALMEFILRLEEEFDITIPDRDLDPDIFDSANTITTYILGRLNKISS